LRIAIKAKSAIIEAKSAIIEAISRYTVASNSALSLRRGRKVRRLEGQEGEHDRNP